MKTTLIGLALMGMMTACNDNASQTKQDSGQTNESEKAVKNQAPSVAKSAEVTEVIAGYLQIKNALAADNAKDAATGGKALADALKNVSEQALDTAQRKVYDDVKDDIKEHAKHISVNDAKIAHQREHFDMLSKDLYDLVKALKPSQTLYQDHCPMYNEGKGANWISEVKEIKNPYLGKKMPDCGSVRETITQ